MNNKELLQLYKELYFHELERKDRITAQAQMRFAFIVTGIALSAYMLRVLDLSGSMLFVWVFVVFLSLAIIPFVCSVWVLSRAFWGNTYEYLPILTEVESYRKDLELHYQDADEEGSCDDDMLNYLLNSFASISSNNAKVNDDRLRKIHCFYKLSLSSLSAFLIASTLFIFADLDASSPRKPLVVEVKPMGQTISSEMSLEPIKEAEINE